MLLNLAYYSNAVTKVIHCIIQDFAVNFGQHCGFYTERGETRSFFGNFMKVGIRFFMMNKLSAGH